MDMFKWPLLTAHQTTLRGKHFAAPNGTNAMHNDRLADSEHGTLVTDYVCSDEGTVFEAVGRDGQLTLWRVVRKVPGEAYCAKLDA